MPLPNTVQEQVDQSLSHGFDGIIVYVDKGANTGINTDVVTNKNTPQFYTAGWHDKKLKIPAKPDALFKIASISKLYVAVSIAKLANNNQLLLDQTLAEYFPELVGKIEYADSITLRLMVQNRSGIPNFTNSAEFWSDAPENKKSHLDYALAMPTSFAPDEGYEYSNTNYLLLRKIIASVTGSSHEQYIKDVILTPLGLDNTFFSLNDIDDINNVMSGYYVGVDDDFKTAEYGMLATAEDVGLFLRALNDGSVFTNAAEQAIYEDIYVYEHGGLVPGYQSLAEYHKDIDTVVVQFMNTTDFNGYEWNLSEISINRIVAIVENEEQLNHE